MTKTVQIPIEFQPLLEKWWDEAAVYGGRNSLKSHTIARILLGRAIERKTRTGCFREYQSSLADSAYQLLKDLCEENELWMFNFTKDSIVNTLNGSEFIFKGLHNNVQSIKSIEGMDYAWVEEAQTVTENSLDVLVPTVRKEGAQIIYSYNRLRDKDPVHKRLVLDKRPNSLVININYDTAIKYGWMSPKLIRDMEYDRDNRPETYLHKWLGEPSNKKGRIYNFKRIEKLPIEAKLVGRGLDWGYTNDPTAIVNVYKYNNGYIIDEVAYEKGLKNFTIGNLIRLDERLPPATRDNDSIEFAGTTSIVTVGDSSEPKSIDEVSECGVAIVGAVKGKDSVNNGIQRMQDLDISYTASSTHIEEEMLNYIWLINKDDKSLNVPVDDYNHLMDAARYIITHLLTFKTIEYANAR